MDSTHMSTVELNTSVVVNKRATECLVALPWHDSCPCSPVSSQEQDPSLLTERDWRPVLPPPLPWHCLEECVDPNL